ncbi:hypothetical protein OV208_15390 [Corallococcus sp. bb12-1]|uniref:hypothetical protein n=1 Tax=Corallococcus sp. bb12-1 TaxID=2996784 RepID=UPI00226D8929|nr:hypothetical protein [Corallococcus sp. bb12-1]MCY1042707.1 hypothetical protein [Corallococcus sp. bb12-1]
MLARSGAAGVVMESVRPAADNLSPSPGATPHPLWRAESLALLEEAGRGARGLRSAGKAWIVARLLEVLLEDVLRAHGREAVCARRGWRTFKTAPGGCLEPASA